MDNEKRALVDILASPIAYYAAFAKIGGGVTAGVFLSQLVYWTGRGKLADGWVWKSARDIEEETGLTYWEQQTARRNLRERNLIEERQAGCPKTTHYRVNLDAVIKAVIEYANLSPESLQGKPSDQCEEKPHTSTRKNLTLVRGKTSHYPETTTEITPESTTEQIAQTAHNAEPEPAPTPRKRKRADAPPSTPKPKISDLPAAKVYHDLTGLWPPRTAYQELAAIQNGGTPRWGEAIKAWCNAGYNPQNIAGILQWWRNGIPEGRREPVKRAPDVAKSWQEADNPDGRHYLNDPFAEFIKS